MCQRSVTCAGVLPSRLAIAPTVGSLRNRPLASGDQASVTMPSSALVARTSSLPRYGCTSIWFTAGTTSASCTRRRRWDTWKFDTPMERAAALAIELLEREPCRDEVAVVQGWQRPMDQKQ